MERLEFNEKKLFRIDFKKWKNIECNEIYYKHNNKFLRVLLLTKTLGYTKNKKIQSICQQIRNKNGMSAVFLEDGNFYYIFKEDKINFYTCFKK